MNIVDNPDFVYALGNFMADGSFYSSNGNYRFEFVDGTPYRDELRHSLKHVSNIRKIFERLLNKKLPVIRQRENRFVLSFRDKILAQFFINILQIKPGPKDYIVDIPKRYIGTSKEVLFWKGYLDGDGSIARNSRRVALESVSEYIINSFADYLDKQGIFYSKYKSKRGDHFSYVVLVRSISFRDFADKIGFNHPLKAKLLHEKLKHKDSFVTNSTIDFNKFLINHQIIDYTQIFTDSVFIEEGINVLRKYGFRKYHISNVKISEINSIMAKAGKNKAEILKEIHNYRFKKSKGSMNSVKLPLSFEPLLLKFAKFIRIRSGSISFSKQYIQAFNEDFKKIIEDFETTFDITPKYTCKNEPLFCSGVLADLFSHFVTNESKAIKS